MRRFGNLRWAAALLAALVLAAAAPAAASGDEVKTIKVKKIVRDCEGDDCGQEKRVERVVFIGEDGEIDEIEGADHVWVGHGDHGGLLHHHGKGGFLGVATTELTPELRRHFGVPEKAGILVGKVVDGSAAALAGIQVGDILTAVDGEAMTSGGALMQVIGRREPGATVTLELWRDGTLETASATLGERPEQRRHARVLRCEGGDCPELDRIGELDCGGAGECKVEVECGAGGCECVVNGEATDCDTLPGFVAPGG